MWMAKKNKSLKFLAGKLIIFVLFYYENYYFGYGNCAKKMWEYEFGNYSSKCELKTK